MIKNPDKYQKGKTFVYFVRHGDRIFIPETKDAGLQIPGPGLSAKGKKQAKKVALEFSKIKDRIDLLYSSNMARAIETAEEISKKTGKKIKIIPEFAEINNFIFKKRIYHKNFWKLYIRYRKAIKAFNKILEENKGKEKVIVIVAHGNLINLLFGKKIGLSLNKTDKFDHHNCHITMMRFNGKKLEYVHCFNSGKLF